jgi:L-ascorbate metabolism protein UlaG (beta-lactamase superfamily)
MRPFLVAVLLPIWTSACATTPAPILAGPAPSPVRVVDSPSEKPAARLSMTRVAHASVLLDFDGDFVLTDPWYSESSQYHHGEPLGLALAALPRLRAVLVSHGHYDHFDVDAFAAYPDKSVPMVLPRGLGEVARKAGFRDVRELDPWQPTRAGELTITAVPAEHGVPEITFVVEGKGRTVYFGGDSTLVPGFDDLPRRFAHFDLALLSVNGLHAVGKQVVMNAEEAATLTGKLRPTVAVPIHYTFRGGWFTDTFILRYDGTPARFLAAAHRTAPATRVEILLPGQRLDLVRAK